MSSILEPQIDESSLTIEGDAVVLETEDSVAASTVELVQETALLVEVVPEVHTFESEAQPSILFESIAEIASVIETSPPQGVKGDPGEAGSMYFEYPVAYAMSGHRIVVLNENQQAIYASNLTPLHANKILGMTIEAVISGNIRIQNGGVLTEPSWSWILDTPIWLGIDGFMTQTAPVSGFSLIIGFPVSSTSMFIDFREPIFLI